jgi:hypothetical protein
MHTRLRLLKAATALLYFGPLLAGLSGIGLGIIAPFVGIFLVWLFILRPEQWPATVEEWLTSHALWAVLAQLLSQVLLVAVLLGVGRGLGALAGFLPALNPALPLALSFLAIPICRSLWDAREAADQGIFLDEDVAAAQVPRALAKAGAAVAQLLNLPDDGPDAVVSAAVGQALAVADPALRINGLAAALASPHHSHEALRQAVILWASEPEVVASGLVPRGMATAFALTAGNGDLLRLYVPRALALVTAFPDRAPDFPTPAQLLHAAASEGAVPGSDLPAHLRADLADGLAALAHAVERALGTAQPPVPARRDPVAQTAVRTA